jgi:membrane protease YdiL (CAAX protease family)
MTLRDADRTRENVLHPLLWAFATTAVVTALSYGVPAEHAASAVGIGFLAATYFLTLRDDASHTPGHYGLSLGGLLEREPLDYLAVVRSAARELGVALGVAAVVFPVFWVGWFFWWAPGAPFHPAPIAFIANEAAGQFLVIALPEEAFYRGYLQTSLDDAWPSRWNWFGTPVGPGLLVTSLIFALGHVATDAHASRLSVFFPSLLFGWLRTRRQGVGCSAAFHALCNLFASYLAHSYGLIA